MAARRVTNREVAESLARVSSHVRRLGITPPPTFSAKRDESFAAFMEKLTEYAIANQWTLEEGCRTFPTLLSGRAKEIYLLIPDDIRGVWDRLVETFTALVLTQSVRTQAQEKLAGAKQEAGEDFLSFYRRVTSLASDAFVTQEERQSGVKAALLRGARRELKKCLLRMPAQARVMELVTRAREEEDLVETVSGTNGITLETLSKQIQGIAEDTIAAIGSGRPRDFKEFKPREGEDRRQGEGKNWHKDEKKKYYKKQEKKNYEENNRDKKRDNGTDKNGEPQPRQGGRYVWIPDEPAKTEGKRGGRIASVLTVPLYISMVFCLLLSFCGVAGAVGEYVICDSTREGTLLALPKIEDCNLPESRVVPLVVRAVVSARRTDYNSVDAVSCSKRTTEICLGRQLIGEDEITHQTFVELVDEERCWRMKNNRRMDAVPLYMKEQGRWESEQPLLPPEVNYSYKCKNITNYLMLEGSVAWMDPNILMSDLGDLSGCSLSHGVCPHPFYNVVWKPEEAVTRCPYEHRGIFDAMVTDTHIVIADLQIAASFVTQEPTQDVPCIAPNVWRLSNDLVVKFPNITEGDRIRQFIKEQQTVVKDTNLRLARLASEEPGVVNLESPLAAATLEKLAAGPPIGNNTKTVAVAELDLKLKNIFEGVPEVPSVNVTRPTRSLTSGAEWNPEDPLFNAKLQFVVTETNKQILKNFLQSKRTICEVHNQQTLLIGTMAVMNPSSAARILLRRNDVAAKFVGEVLSITPCRKLIPEVIYWNYTYNGHCYAEVPVKVGKDLFFSIPGTKELKKTGSVVPCETIVDGVYRKENGQFSTERGLKEVQMMPEWRLDYSPLELVFREAAPSPGRGGYFAPEPESRTRRRLDEVEEVQQVLGNALGGNYREMKEFVAEKTEVSEPWYSRISDAVSDTWDNTVNSGKSFLQSYVNTVRETMLKLLLWIIVPILVTVALVLTVYMLIRCWWSNRKQKMFAKELAKAQVKEENRKLLPKSRRPSPPSERKTPPARPPPPKKRVETVENEEKNEEKVETEETALVNAVFASAPREEDEDEPYAAAARGFSATRTLFSFVPLVCTIQGAGAAPLPYVKVFINNKPIVVLMDTGSSVTFISETAAYHISEGNWLPPTRGNAKAANGTEIRFLGSIDALFYLGGVICRFRAQITKDCDCPGPGIIGVDMLRALNRKKVRVELNFDEEYVAVGRQKLKILCPGEIIEEDSVPTYAVTVDKEIILEPGTDNLLWSSIDEEIPEDWELLIEGNELDEDSLESDEPHHVIGRTLAMARKGKVPVRMLNMSKEPIVLRKGQQIAHAETTAERDSTVAAVEEHCPPEANWKNELPRGAQPHFDIGEVINLEASMFNAKEKKKLRDIVRRNAAAFVGPDGKIGRYNGPVQHEIRLVPGARPPALRPYRVPLEKRKEIEAQLAKMLDEGLIRESKSPFSAPVVLVKKADKKSWRFTVDYRRLNSITEKESYFLPLITDILDLVGGKKIYSTFDLQSGYYQVALREEDTPKTAFTTFAGQFEFLVLSQGLCGAPATFARCMNDALRNLKAAAYVYLDDIVLASSSTRQHLVDIEELLKTLKNAGLKLRHDKCAFGQAEVAYLGFLLSADGVRVNPEKTDAVKKFPEPKNLKELRQFLGAAGHCRRFIHRYADIAAPLTKLMKKDVPYAWSEEQQEAFEGLKSALTSAPVLRSPQLGQPFEVHTDASKVAVAGVLLQKDEKELLHPIAFTSRRTNKHEERYPPVELEALAIAHSVKQFAPYITGAKTLVLTDHQPLRSLMDRQDLDGRLAKYQISLASFDLDINYRPGKWNEVADALSRNPPMMNEKDKINAVRPSLERLTLDDLRSTQDSFLPKKLLPSYFQEDGIWKTIVKDEVKIVVPPAIRLRLMKETHEDPLEGGHLGGARLTARLQKMFTWPRMSTEIKQFTKSCKECQLKKTPAVLVSTEPLGEVALPSAPMEDLHMDFLGPYPTSASGNRYVHVIVDNFTKMAYVDPLPDTKTPTLIESFLKNIIYKEGCPLRVTTDQGSQYLSKDFQEVLNSLGIKHRRSTAHHHQSNGSVERFNRTLGEMIAIYAKEKAEFWDEYVLPSSFAYNTTPHSELTETPFFLSHGRDAILPTERIMRMTVPRYADVPEYKFLMASRIRDAFSLTKVKLDAAAARRKEEYDQRNNVREKKLMEGDLVLVRAEVAPGTSSKLHMPWKGPFRIVKIERPNAELSPIAGGKTTVVHLNRMKKYHCAPVQLQLRKEEEQKEDSGSSADRLLRNRDGDAAYFEARAADQSKPDKQDAIAEGRAAPSDHSRRTDHFNSEDVNTDEPIAKTKPRRQPRRGANCRLESDAHAAYPVEMLQDAAAAQTTVTEDHDKDPPRRRSARIAAAAKRS